jgi:hypothetical protein
MWMMCTSLSGLAFILTLFLRVYSLNRKTVQGGDAVTAADDKEDDTETTHTHSSGSVTNESTTEDITATPLPYLSLSPDLMEDWFPHELLQGRRSPWRWSAILGIQESSRQPSRGLSITRTVDLPSVEDVRARLLTSRGYVFHARIRLRRNRRKSIVGRG